MSRKHRVVHLVSLIALVLSLLSPILTLPVTAQDSTPEPEATLLTGDDAGQTGTEVPDAPVETEVVGPPVDDPPVVNDPPVVEEPPAPVLIMVIPQLPIISDVACVEGSIYAQSASPAVTDGVGYEISAPDAAGAFTVTATLIDASVYAWSDVGLEGWSVNGNQAVSSGTLTLCPPVAPVIEEPAASEPVIDEPAASQPVIDDPAASEPAAEGAGDLPTTSEIKEEVDSAVQPSTPETEEAAEPTIGRGPARETISARGMSIAVAGDGMSIAMTADSDFVAPGDVIIYTITVTNYTGADQHYTLTDTLPAGTTFSGATVPYAAFGDYCTPSGGTVTCGLADGMVLYPGWSDVWTISVLVDVDASVVPACNDGLTNTVTGDWAENNSASVRVGVQCAAYQLSVTATTSLQPGEITFPGQTIRFTMTVTNTGNVARPANTQYRLSIAPVETSIAWNLATVISMPGDANCPIIGQLIQCTRVLQVGMNPGDADVYEFQLVLPNAPSADQCTDGIELQYQLFTNTQNLVLGTLVTPINCELLSISVYGPAEMSPLDPMTYRVEVHNNGTTTSSPFSWEFIIPEGSWLSIRKPVDCSQSGVVFSCTETPLPRGVSLVYFFTLGANQGGEIAECSIVQATATGTTGQWKASARQSTLTTTVTGSNCGPNLTIELQANKTVASVGDEVDFTIKVKNEGSQRGGTYGFAVDVWDQIAFLSAPYEITGWDSDIGCTSSPPEINCADHLNPISPGGEVTITVNTVVAGSGCADVATVARGSGEGWSSDPGKNTSSVTTTINCTPLSIAQSAPATTRPNKEFTYEVTVSNVHTGASDDYAFTDPLPAGVELVEIVSQPTGATCTPVRANNMTTINCEGSGVPAQTGGVNGTHVYTFKVKTNSDLNSALCGTSLSNTVSGTAGPWGQVNSATSATSVTCDPSLSLTISADKSVAEPGDDITYKITVTNNGDSIEDLYLFRAALPADTRLTAAPITTPAGLNCHGNTTGDWNVDCQAENLGPGESHTFTYTGHVSENVTPTMCQGLNTWLRGTSWGAWDENVVLEPTGWHYTIPMNCPELSVSIDDDVDDIAGIGLNETFNYVVTLTNSGATAKGSFTVVTYLPTGVVTAGDMPAGCTGGAEGGQSIVTCAGSQVPIGTGVSFTIPVMGSDASSAPVCGTVQGKALGIWGKGIWKSGEQDDYVSTKINCISELTVTLEPMKSTVLPGETIGWVATFQNTGNTNIVALTPNLSSPGMLPDRGSWSTHWELNGAPYDLAGFSGLKPGDIVKAHVESTPIPEDISVPESEWCVTWMLSLSYTAEFSNGGEIGNGDAGYVFVNCTDLVLDLQVSSPRIQPGDQVTYTLTVTNNGTLAISPVQVFFDNNEASNVFSNWSVSSGDAIECWLTDAGTPTCWFLTLDPQQTVVVTITASSPTAISWEQCVPVVSGAYALYGEVLTPMLLAARVSLPYTEIYSNDITTQVDCQPDISIEKAGEADSGADGRMDAGDLVTYTYRVTNTGNVPLFDISIKDSMESLEWVTDSTIAALQPGDSVMLTATYPVTRADLDLGSVSGTAEVTGRTTIEPEAINPPAEIVRGSVISTTYLEQEYGLNLTVDGDFDLGDDNQLNAGDGILLTVAVENTGNITIYDITVTDVQGVEWNANSTIAELPAGESATISGVYTITQADLDAGFVDITVDVGGSVVLAEEMLRSLQLLGMARAQVSPGITTPVSGTVTERFQLVQGPAIELTASGVGNTGGDGFFSPDDAITYTFTVTNTGNTTLTEAELVVDNPGVVFVDGTTIASLDAGAEITLTGTYTVTQADIDAGLLVVCADVAALDPAGETVSHNDVCVRMGIDGVPEVPVTPTPIPPTVVPGTPIPEPTVPGTPVPTAPAAQPTATSAVSQLPDTGDGPGMGTGPMMWVAMMTMVIIGIGALGIRKGTRQ